MDENFKCLISCRKEQQKHFLSNLPFFLLHRKETKNQGSEFNFVRKIFFILYLQFVANNFNSFLKLDFSECSYRNSQNVPVSSQELKPQNSMPIDFAVYYSWKSLVK